MSRRITFCVVFVTLIWGASAENEEKIRDIIKSNMTRNEFSNLLKSLIKLNEQRVSVLHKLYKLEDYGILSEMLRSGDKKITRENLSNLFLIVLSKNLTDPSRRTVGSQVVGSVPLHDVGSNKFKTPEVHSIIHPKQEHVLEQTGESIKTLPKEKKLELIIGDNPTAFRSKHRYEIDDGSHIFTTSTRPHKNMHIELIGPKHYKPDQDTTEEEHSSNLTRIHKASLKPKRGNRHHKEVQDRFEIVSNERKSPNTSQEILDYTDNINTNPPIAKNNGQSSFEIDLTMENVHNTKLIKIKDKLPAERQGSKYPPENKHKSNENDHSTKFTPLSREKSIETYHSSQYGTPNSDMSKEHDHDNEKARTNKDKGKENKYDNKYSKLNKDTSSVENYHEMKYPQVNSDKGNENDRGNHNPKINLNKSNEYELHNQHPKIYDRSTENDHNNQNYKINRDKSNENDHNNQNYKINRDKSNENDHNNQNYKINRDRSNESDQGNKYSKMNTAHSHENDHRIYLNVNKDKINENDYGNKYSKINKEASNENDHESSKYHNFNRDTNEFDHDNKYSKINRYVSTESDHKFLPLSIYNENAHGNKFSKITKDVSFMGDYGNKHHTDLGGKSNEDKLTIAKDLSYEENHSHMKPKNYDREEYNNYDKMSMEFGGGAGGSDAGNAHSNIGRDRSLEPKRLKINLNGFEQPEKSPESRKNFQKCISKRALKLCSKSCISAYKNVCRKFKCTSRSKKALKKECKRSCKKTFSSSKYSREESDDRS